MVCRQLVFFVVLVIVRGEGFRGQTSHNQKQRNDSGVERLVQSDWPVPTQRKKKKDDGSWWSPTASYAPSFTPKPTFRLTASFSPAGSPSLVPSSTPFATPSTEPLVSPSLSEEPSASPTTVEEKSACETAADSRVYYTETSVTVRFLYELLSPADRDVSDVAFHVDEKIQDFLVDLLVDCSKELSVVRGVGPGELDIVVENACSTFVPEASSQEVCHLMEGTVVLYLTTDGSLSEEEGLERISKELSAAFNGAGASSLKSSWVSVQSLFIDPNLGILGLYYIGGRVDEEGDKISPNNGGEIIVADTNDKASKALIPATVAPVALAACVAVVVLALVLARRRQRRSKDTLRGLLLIGDVDDDIANDTSSRWIDMDGGSQPSFQVQVLTTTEDDSSATSSSSEGVSDAVAVTELVLADLRGMTMADSLLQDDAYLPTFLKTDLPTVYYKVRSKRRMELPERDYFVDDTVDI